MNTEGLTEEAEGFPGAALFICWGFVTSVSTKFGLPNLAEKSGNISPASKAMQLLRCTFYRYKGVVEEGGVQALTRQSPKTASKKA